MRIKRLINTLIHLKFIQIIYRIKRRFISQKKRTFKNVLHKKPDLFVDGLHNDEEYLLRFKTIDNTVDILNQRVELKYRNRNDISPLIKFNLEYFEYAIVWAQKGIPFSFFKTKWKEYVDSNVPLHPYVISLQIPNVVIALSIYKVDDQDIFDELYARYKWLIKNQEKHLLANHYFENLKAIVIGSYLFNDSKTFKKYLRKLQKECDEEILEDGVHFELSPMYHKLVLEDLILIRKICNEKWIDEYIAKMMNASLILEKGFGRTPLFNDSGDNVSKSVFALKKSCNSELGIEAFDNCSLADSGYFKIEKNNLSLLIDAGLIGPKYNPGHAHCDCLSFELFKDCSPLFVNSGTYAYQGEKRKLFRTTSSHNTFMIKNHEQSDCWSEHRVGKRIRKAKGSLKQDCFFGTFLNQFGEKYERKISLDSGILTVLDSVKTKSDKAMVESFLHLAPGYCLKEKKICGFGKEYHIDLIDCCVKEIDSLYSPEFGSIEANKCLVFSWKKDNNMHGFKINLVG